MAGFLRQAVGLGIFIAVCFLVAGLGSIWTAPNVESWYAKLSKPTWTPPGWVFGPVWSLLYLSMAVAAWLVWRQAGFPKAAWPMAVFGLQLALNAAWSGLFFGLHSPGLAFVDIVLLWCAILSTLVVFRHHSAAAGWLLVPYLAWVTFAAILNLAIWRMNG
jgi:benzodiazapine receptor